jgi:hypothetical protein
MRLLALGLFACACLALAPANALAARSVKPVISPSVGTRSTVFKVVFRAGDSVNAGNGTYYEVRVKASAGSGCVRSQNEYEVLASRGERLTLVFNPGRRRWCRGSWSGAAYWVRDRALSPSGCTASPCLTRNRVGKFGFRVNP